MVAANPEAVIGRFTTLTDVDSDQSAATRYYMITSTLEIIRDHWAMGTGLGAFDMAYPAYRIAGSSFSVIRPHQLPLAMWAEMGIAGLVAEITITLAVLRTAWTSIRAQGSSAIPNGMVDLLAEAGDRLTLGQKAGLAIIASYAVGSLFQYFLYIEYLWFGVALLAGSTIARAALSSEVQDV
ncbi:MAG TPA: O-antigen ligase domain-containing protein [Actinobacteria bacterium]|nr:O-antigen ligase domain-containing protein [Actinomycetota bacterium]